MDRIRVYSPQGEPGVVFRDDAGKWVPGRYVARDRDGKPLPDGEEVASTVEILREIRRGHLTTKAPSAPAQAPTESVHAPEASAPTPLEQKE